MSEFERTPTEPGTGAKLAARLKFERYVFIAFFAAMTMLAVAMLVEFRRQQEHLQETHTESADLQTALRQAQSRFEAERGRFAQLEQDSSSALAKAGEREARRSRELGQALVQLALLDADGGAAARARGRALLEDATRYGEPDYVALARWALLDTSKPLAPLVEKSAFHAAAVSQDGEYLAIARDTCIELYQLSQGRKPVIYTHPANAGQPAVLALGSGLLAAGYAGGLLALTPLRGEARWQTTRLPSGLRHLAFSPGSTRLAACDEVGNLRLHDTASLIKPLFEARCEDRTRALAVLDDAGGPLLVITDLGGLLEFNTRGDLTNFKLTEQKVRRAAICPMGKVVRIALQCDAGIEATQYTPGIRPAGALPVSPAPENVSALALAPDGTLLLGDALGRVIEFSHAGSALPAYRLGSDSPLSFLARAGVFVLGMSADGAFSCRLVEDFHLRGVPLAPVEDRPVVATSQGFASEKLGVWSARLRSWVGTTGADRSMPAGLGFVGAAGKDAAFGADRIRNCGRLLCAFTTGNALFKPDGSRLLLVSPGGERLELALPSGLEPDFALAAAQAETALMVCGGRLFIANVREQSLRELAPRATGAVALDAEGARVALVESGAILITAVQSAPLELRIAPRHPPRALALLFKGTVLCSLEDGALAFYDTATGRELLRRATRAVNLAAGDRELFLVSEADMRVLSVR